MSATTIHGLDRSKYPSRMGKGWTWDEDTKLLEEVRNGVDLENIARAHERTEGGIWCHLCLIAYRMFTENHPMGEIMAVTGLSESEIIDHIKKNNANKEKKEEKKQDRKERKERKKIEKKTEDPSHLTEAVSKLEIVNLISDIQTKMTRLNILVAMMN